MIKMVKQAGKTHDYPASRRGYTTSRNGIGSRKPKNDKDKPPQMENISIFNHFRKEHQNNLFFQTVLMKNYI